MTLPGLYLHIPFCETKCGYCDFYSVTTLREMPSYSKALLKEIDFYAREYSGFDTIYIGGGTPSLLTAAVLSKIIDHIRKTFSITADAEVTLELNPADAQVDFLSALEQMGVNRLILGIQSFNDGLLGYLGRRHTGRQATESIEQARQAGFDNIGIDLIYGIPGQSFSCWQDTLGLALDLKPQHISCYQLTLPCNTPLAKRHQNGEFSLPDEDEQAEFFMITADILQNAGYRHYEVSNFSRTDEFKSRHNQKYWNHTPYLGIGASAHSLAGNKRWWNHESLHQYLADIEQGRPPVQEYELLTPKQRRLETCFLGLRTTGGVSLSHFLQDDCGYMPDANKTLNSLAGLGYIEISDGFLKPTRSGMLLADSLALMIADAL